MTMSKVSRRDHHAQLGAKARSVQPRAACDTETLYLFPTKDTTFNVSSGDITFEWDTSCMTATLVDLTLQAPELAKPVLKIFRSVTYADGSYSTPLDPTWWNSTSSINLQLSLAAGDNNVPSFASSSTVVGPVFEAVYTPETTTAAAAAAAVSSTAAARSDPIVVEVDKEHSGSALPAGSIFAAVFFPVAAVAAVAVAYILWVRKKQAKKSKRWSAAVDQRMSRISTEWRASTAGSLQPDMRQSGDRRTVLSMHSSTAPNFAGRGVYRGDDGSSSTGGGSPVVGPDGYTDAYERPPRLSYAGSGSLRVSFGDGARPSSTHLSGSGSRQSLNLGGGSSTGAPTVGSRKSYQAPSGSRLSLGHPSSGTDTKGRWSVAGPVAVNLDMRVAPEQAPWVLGEEDEGQEVLDGAAVNPASSLSPGARRPHLASRRSEGARPLSINPAMPPPTARLISPMASPIVGCPPSPDLGQASDSWFGMTPSMSSTSLSPDEKLQRHADAQAAASAATEARSP